MSIERLQIENDDLRRRLEEAESALRRRSAEYEALLNQAPLGVYVVDADFRIREMNPTALPVFSTIPNVIGRDFAEVVHILWPREVADDVVRIFRHTLETGEPYEMPELVERRSDRGVTESYEWRTNRIPLPEGGYGVVCFFRDISRQVLARTTAESEERLRFVMDSMPQKIFTARPSGEVDYFNPQWTAFTGLSFETIKDWGWTQFIHPDDLGENVRAWQHSIETGEPFHCEHRVRSADGEYRWHVSRAVALKDEESRIRMWVGSNSDIHDVKEAGQRKDEFLALLAHELRNPLAPIRNGLNVLDLTVGDKEPAKGAIDMMRRQVRHMVRLVDDLLDVARLSRGKIDLRRERITLAAVLSNAVEAARPLCDSMDHELTVTLPSQPFELDADPVRLAQVVGNLLHNAGKFTERRGRIGLAAERDGAQAVIRVRDTGIGLAPDQLSRVFEMFTQVDASLERAQGGLGIGLSLARILVELHGGTIEAYSAGVGQGSEFVVRLPVIVDAAAPAPIEALDAQPAARVARRVLVVDDNPDSVESMAVLLELKGYEVHTAHDGLEAIDADARLRPDVVLLDIGLPNLNGYEAGRRIRKQHGDVVLVALTGWAQDGDRRLSAEAGFDGHMAKPVEVAALLQLLKEVDPASRTRRSGGAIQS